MSAVRRSVLALGMLAVSHAADAFGPRTHLWIGNQVLDELRNECTIQLASRPYRISPDLCRAITSEPESFNAGVLGPDIYPDLVAGQNTTHSGVRDGWQTSEFLEHVISRAETPPSRAYAAGYLVHAAGDVFGHSYINAYAGDVWNLSGERLVELRHCTIEKYIDAHLPPLPSAAATFRAPVDFVRDTLVHNGEMRAQYQRAAKHLASMMAVKATIDDLAARADALSSTVPDVLARCTEAGITLTAQLIDGEAALATLSAALDVAKSGAAAQRVAFDAASREIAAAADAVRQHESKLRELTNQAQAQQQAAAAAREAARQASISANEIRTFLSGLVDQIRSVPPRIVESACRTVTDPVCDALCPEGSSNPLCLLCSLPREICTAAERANEEYERLNRQIAEARQRLDTLESSAAEQSARADAATANADALLQQRAEEAAVEPGVVAAKSAAEERFRGTEEQYRRTELSVATLQNRIDELRGRAEANRRALVDSRAIADEVRRAGAQLNLLSHVLHGWQRGVDHAGSAFVRVGERIGHGMLDGRRHLITEYRRWLACEGSVYLAVPYHVADVSCSVETAAQQLPRVVRDLADAGFPEPLRNLYDRVNELRARVETELTSVLASATTELVRFVGDQTTADFVDLLVNPQHASRAKLDEVLATPGRSGESELLVFGSGADLIDRDLGLRNDTVDPSEFAALSSALTLAKLALLDQSETRKMIRDVGGPEALAAYDAGRFDVGRSVLLTAVRSLDGSEQWQPYALPYPRASGGGSPSAAAERRYGFGPGDANRGGFPLFVDPVLRERVFLKLFPRQIHGEIAKRPEMAVGRYPFPICDGNPFPVTFLPGGAPAAGDSGCSSQAPASGAR